MKLAYVSIFGSDDIHAWSGTGYFIRKALAEAGFEVKPVGHLRYDYDFIYKIKDLLYPKLLAQRYDVLWDAFLLKRFAAQIEQALAHSDCDVVFSVWTNPVAYLRTEKPLVICGDGTFAGLQSLYPGYQNLCAETIRDAHRAERRALGRCCLAIYSSDWAAESAVRDYGADPRKVKVVPFGANLDCPRTADDIWSILSAKTWDTCRLLFIGKEWARKGGAAAVAVADLLNQRGIPAELHLVGCQPPADLPSFVKSHGFISKSIAAGRQALDALFALAHFFILPTRAEAYGIVFAEASSFGLPSLATDVGGIPTVIRDGVNGFTFPLDAGPEAYCATVERLWADRGAYESLALSSFNEYAARLSWHTAGRQMRELIQDFCG